MATPSLSPTLASLSSSSTLNIKHCTLSISLISLPQHTQFHFSKCNPQLGICKFSTWNGLRHVGIPTSRYTVKIGRKGKYKGKGVYASLFGVGAPEALVIGVVALLVFGPKGLAEVARNIGKTLRAFQPTIRELQDVSREFKSTLEREIGLDEIQDTVRRTPPSPSTTVSEDSQKPTTSSDDSPSSSNAYTTEEYLKVTEEQLKKQKEVESRENGVEPERQSQGSSPSSSEASFTVENAGSSTEQLEASAALQQKETESTESQVVPQSQKQGASPPVSEAETQEYLKKLEEEVQAVIAEKQKKAAPATTDATSQVSDTQEAASVTPQSQKPESEA